MTEELEVNVAPSSTEGHFVKGAKQVIDIDAVSESFLVKGKSTLRSANHMTLTMPDSCIITCQMVYNCFEKAFEKSRD